MKVVADASPLIALAKIGQFHLLRKLFGSLIVTPEVYAEVVVIGAGLPQPADLSAAQIRFAPGEVSALVLAKEIHADLILIADLEARKMARSEGLRV